MADEAPQIVRRWKLLLELCATDGGATVHELARQLRVVDKTIRRDLKAFRRAGLPIQEVIESFGRKRYRIDGEADRFELTLSLDEALALFLARRRISSRSAAVLEQLIAAALQKVEASFAPTLIQYLECLAGSSGEKWLGTRQVRSAATPPGQRRRGSQDGGRHGSQDGSQDGGIPVRLRFSPAVAAEVESKRWHPTQRSRRDADRNLLVEMTLHETDAVKEWVLGFGRHAEVLKPTSLRNELRDELMQAVRQYDADPPPMR